MKRAALVAAVAVVLQGCFFLPSEEYACRTNTDCAGLPGTTCNLERGVCERGSSTSGSSGMTGGSSGATSGSSAPLSSGGGSSGVVSSSGGGSGSSSTGRMSSSMGPVNHPPVVQELALEVAAAGTVTGMLQATDQDMDPLTFALQVNGLQGSASVMMDGSVSYTANPMVVGEDAFLVEVSDGRGGTAVARVSVLFTRAFNATKTWVGGSAAGPTFWSEPGNWNPMGVPGVNDDVLIPPTPTNRPQLTAAVQIHALEVEAGATLNLSTFTLLTVEAFSRGTIQASSGRLRFQAVTSRFMGSLPNVEVNGQCRVVGTTSINGDLNLNTGNPRLDLGTARATVTGDLTVNGNSMLIMTTTMARLTVQGNANFTGVSTNGFLTAGTLELQGNVVVTAQGFQASGEHLTILNATASRLIQVEYNDTRFANLTVTGAGATVAMTNGEWVTVLGTLDVAPASSFRALGSDLSVEGPVRAGAGSTLGADELELYDASGTDGIYGTLAVRLLTLKGVDQLVVAGLSYQDLQVNGRALMKTGVVLTGSLLVEGQNTRAVVEGVMDVAQDVETWGGGSITMNTPGAALTVGRHARLTGSSGVSDIIDGILEVHGDLYGRFEGLLASLNHRTRLDGTTRQTLYMEGAGIQGNNAKLRHLDVNNPMGVTVDTGLYVSGDLRVLQGNISGGALTLLEVGSSAGGSFVVPQGSTVSVARVTLYGPVGTTQMAGAFDTSLVTFDGDRQTVGVVTGGYPSLRLRGTDTTVASGVQVLGDMTVDSGGNVVATLDGTLQVDGVLLVTEGADLRFNGHDVTAATLRVAQSSQLVMTGGTVRVGTFTLDGASASDLRGGVLEVGGNFTASYDSYRPAMGHRLAFTGTTSLSMEGSGGGSGNALGVTEIRAGAVVTLATDIAAIDTVTVRGGSSGGTLTVPAGTILRIAAGKELRLEAGATLNVAGTLIGTCVNMGATVNITGNATCP